MVGTRFRKVVRDIWSRKVRTLLVAASIFIGVFGVVTLFSTGDLLIKQLEADIHQDRLAMIRTVVTVNSQAEVDNAAHLAALRDLPGVSVVEGRSVSPLLWRLPGEDRFVDGTIAAYSEPFDQLVLEAPRLIEGDYPQGQQVAIERRMAERYGLHIGDTIEVRILSQSGSESIISEPYTISGIMFQAYGELAGPSFAGPDSLVFANYADAQHIAGFTGFSHLYTRFIDFPTAEHEASSYQASIASLTPYVPVFTAIEDPASSPLIENTRTTNQVLVMLALVALIVSGFLVINVVNSLVFEQRRQIGVMKSLGASRVDNIVMYAGIALSYGVIGVIPGVLLGIPGGYAMAQALATQSNTIIENFSVSIPAVIIGVLVGLAVPLLAAIVPVLNGTRVSILEAMTDLGIDADYSHGIIARTIARIPMPITLRQAINNVNQKKFRLALTGTTLTVAVGAFMGIFAVFSSLSGVIDNVFGAFGSQISIDPNEGQTLDTVRGILNTDRVQTALEEKGLPQLKAVEPASNLSLQIEGYNPPPVSGGPPGIFSVGFNTENPEVTNLDMVDGVDWRDDPTRQGIVISTRIADYMDKKVGDSLVLMAGGGRGTFNIIGIANFPFDAVWMPWEDLARLGGLVINAPGQQSDVYPNSFNVILDANDPSAATTDQAIEQINEALLSNGITANYTNWVEFKDTITQFIQVFNIILYLAAGLIAAVGALGLLTSLSMSVFERQKEIGVMRSVGATSRTVTVQFLIEGLTVGVVAWLIGIPLGYLLAQALIRALPFAGFGVGFPPETVLFGLVGMLVVVTAASLWPSLAAARRTVSDILRYQ